MDKDTISFLMPKQQEYEHDYGMEMDRLGEDIGEDVIRVYRQWMLPLSTVNTDVWNISKLDKKWAITVREWCLYEHTNKPIWGQSNKIIFALGKIK